MRLLAAIVSAAIVARAILPASDAVARGLENADEQTTRRNSAGRVYEYISKDGEAVGRLTYYGLPRSALDRFAGVPSEYSPVTFNGYPSSPSPYSSPLSFVVVNKKSSIRIDLVGAQAEECWSFKFRDIGIGDYRFRVLAPAARSEWYNMTVSWADSTVGEVKLKQKGLIEVE